MGSAQLGPIAKLEHCGDQVNQNGREQFAGVMEIGLIDFTQKKPEVQSARENDEKTKNNLLEVHCDACP